MKKYILILLSAILGFTACEDGTNIVFEDYYVCIKDEAGSSSSTVSASAQDLVVTYYVQLVSAARKDNLTVDYEIIVGDGLTEGVDFELATQSRTVTFLPGIYRTPIRINYLKHSVDASKDNSITIKLVSTSDSSIGIGYPGPSAKYSSYSIKKVN